MPLNALPDTSLVYHSRTSACPTAIAHTSGAPRAKLPGVIPDLSDFYPPKLQRLAQEGSVILSIRVSAAGCVTAVAIRRSSGMDEMDVAAREWIETASFMPGELDGVAVESTVPLAVNFQLKN